MKEVFEFRINNDYYHLLPKPNNGKNNGSVHVVRLTIDDPNFEQIRFLSEKIEGFYFGWQIKREYSKKELDTATLLQMKIKSTFEPAGEECGTEYDEIVACEICGANRIQIGALKLKKGSMPKKDIARTIAGEVVVSEKFSIAYEQSGLKGTKLEPVVFNKGTSGYYQLNSTNELTLTENTVAGGDIFDLSIEGSEGAEFIMAGGHHIKFEKEIYKCPKGHLIGLNLLSEAYVANSPLIAEYDFFTSQQKIGVKRGLLRPEPLYLCSTTFRQMVEEEKLSGFDFEVAHIQ